PTIQPPVSLSRRRSAYHGSCRSTCPSLRPGLAAPLLVWPPGRPTRTVPAFSRARRPGQAKRDCPRAFAFRFPVAPQPPRGRRPAAASPGVRFLLHLRQRLCRADTNHDGLFGDGLFLKATLESSVAPVQTLPSSAPTTCPAAYAPLD